METDFLKTQAVGRWGSLAIELRPSQQKNEDGSAKPFYLKRYFILHANHEFELEVINYADPYGKLPLARMLISGHIEWKDTHPLITDAYKVDFIADRNYEVTPLHEGFAKLLNSIPQGYPHWEVGRPQSIFKKVFLPFGLKEGQIFKEYDLIYLQHDFMFWGARHVDGRGFDTEENRPTNLQIPMQRQA